MNHHPPAVERLARMVAGASRAVALTGAGVSTDSGIPDFRSPDGTWRQVDPFVVASVSGLRANPAAFYEFWRWRFGRLSEAEPNITHRVLAALERQGLLECVVTQNIDGLHRRAGSSRVYEVHGAFDRAHCLDCGAETSVDDFRAALEGQQLPVCAYCQGMVKPAVVLFEEGMPPAFDQTRIEVARADLLLVLGSSLEVYPVAGLVPEARAHGASVAIVNRDRTAYDGMAALVIHDDLATTMRGLAEALRLAVA